MAAVNASGTSIAYGDGGDPENFTAIANVTNIDAPAPEVGEIDATAHDSPDDYMEFLPSWIDPGEASIEINYDPAEHNTIVAMLRTVQNWQISFPDGSTVTFPGYLQSFERGAPLDDKLTGSMTIRATGKATDVAA